MSRDRDKQILEVLRDIDRTEHAILEQLRHPPPCGMVIYELVFHRIGAIMSTPAGGTSVFQEVPTPTGSQFPTGTTFTWSVDDTADITLAPYTPAGGTSPDPTYIQATCVANPTGTSYNLTCQSSYIPPGATTGISQTINVPIIIPAQNPTGMAINQIS